MIELVGVWKSVTYAVFTLYVFISSGRTAVSTRVQF